MVSSFKGHAMNDGPWNSRMMEDWNVGILGKTKKLFSNPLFHYSTLPFFQ